MKEKEINVSICVHIYQLNVKERYYKIDVGWLVGWLVGFMAYQPL